MQCEKAKRFFHNYLDGQRKEEVPQSVQLHIRDCSHCREEIRCLGQVMNGDLLLSPDKAYHVSALNSLLEAHFKYAETPVTCALAKGFLPGMVSQGIKITISTPITEHIRQCSVCRHIGLKLQSLCLSDAQLQRLSECVKHGSDTHDLVVDHLSDEQVTLFARVDYASLDASCLEHLCSCTPCRKRIVVARQTGASQSTDETPECNDISYQDLFDLALPLGFNPLTDEHTKERESAVQHISHCQTCLGHLGSLDHMLIDLLSPYDSGVVTDFHLDLDEARAITDDEHAGHPIQVGAQMASASGDSRVGQMGKTRSTKVRSNFSWMKAAAVVAVLLGITIFSMLPEAGADFLDQVYDATTSAPVVHITISASFSRGNNSAVRKEHWIFPPNRAVTIEGQTKTVFDAKAGLVRITDATGNQSQTELERDQTEWLKQDIRGIFGVWPM